MTWQQIFTNLVEPKDIIRACTVPSTRLDSMFRAITNERKKIARAICVYLVNRIKRFIGLSHSVFYSDIDFLYNTLGTDIISQGSELHNSLNIPDIELFVKFYRLFDSMIINHRELENNPEVRKFIRALDRKCDQLVLSGDIADPINGVQFTARQTPNNQRNNSYRGFFRPVSDEDVNEELVTETYTDEEIDKLIGRTFNLQKIENIYRRKKYKTPQLFAHTRCIKCGREKRVFLSNLINDPDKYGSCICSDKNLDSRIDNVSQLYSNKKRLSTNTSGYTGVSFVRNYAGEPYNKWRAYIEVDGTRTYLGDFDTKKEAIKARKEAGEKGIKWYKENRGKLVKNVRKRTKKYKTSKYRDTVEKTKVSRK